VASRKPRTSTKSQTTRHSRLSRESRMSRVSRKARFANRARGSIITSQEGRPRRKAKGDETGRPYRRQGLQPARLRGKRATKRR
jgi:hypothetical protein